MISGGMGTLAAAALMICDGDVPAGTLTNIEAGNLVSGSLDGCGNPVARSSLPSGWPLTFDDCKRHLGRVFLTIPSFGDRSEPSAPHLSHSAAVYIHSVSKRSCAG